MQVGASHPISGDRHATTNDVKPSGCRGKSARNGHGKRLREAGDASSRDRSSSQSESDGASQARSESSLYSDRGPPPSRQPFRHAGDRMSDFTLAAGDALSQLDSSASTEGGITALSTPVVLEALAAVAFLGEPECQPTPLHRAKIQIEVQSSSTVLASPKDDRPSCEGTTGSSFLLPPQDSVCADRHTLVLDLDETLVHSSYTSEEWFPEQGDFECDVHAGDETVHCFVRLRPGVTEFLEKVSGLYEVVLFTAGIEAYGREVLRLLDPDAKFFHHALFRQHCSYYLTGPSGCTSVQPDVSNGSGAFHNIGHSEPGEYVKDLSRLGRPIDRVIIIDNNPKCFMLHPRNAIESTTWRYDRSDNELANFGEFLEAVYIAPDVFWDMDNYHEQLAAIRHDLETSSA